MKIQMNGVTLEDVTVEEALQLLNSTGKKQKLEAAILERPVLSKIKYDRPIKSSKRLRNKVWWLREEVEYIISNPNLSPIEVHKSINRHSVMSISVLSSAIRRNRVNEMGKKVKGFVTDYYNKQTTRTNKIPVKVIE